MDHELEEIIGTSCGSRELARISDTRMRWDEFGKLVECGFDEVTFEMVPIERRVEVILMKTCHQPDLKTEMRRHLLGAGSGNPSGLHSKPALPRVRWRKIIAFYLIVWTVLVATSAFSAIASAIERTAAEPPKGNQATHFIDRQTKRALPEPPGTVLFVGNSFTFWHEGLWTHMGNLTAARGRDRGAETSRVVRGGASLRVLWKRTKAKQVIAEGSYDIVVLQEDLPETKVSDFHKYAALFDEQAREAGSRLIFFMSWDYQRLNWISMDEIIAEHKRMARKLDVEIAPCGYAWQRAMQERPKVEFYSRDREHQSWYGTILNLYVIYSTIYGESPEALRFSPPKNSQITAEEDAWLRRVAWKSVQSWQQQMKEGS